MGHWNTILLAFALFAQGATASGPVSGSVSGHVTGFPAASAAATTIVMDGAVRLRAPIQSDGSFEFRNVRPGEYRVAFDPPSDSIFRVINVLNRDLKDIEIPFRISSFKVRGTAVGETALRQQGRIPAEEFVWVTLRSTYKSGPQPSGKDGYKGAEYGRGEGDRQRVNPDGTFRFSDVPQGTYTMSFFKNCICCPPGKSNGCDYLELYKADIPDVIITDRDVTGLTFPLKF